MQGRMARAETPHYIPLRHADDPCVIKSRLMLSTFDATIDVCVSFCSYHSQRPVEMDLNHPMLLASDDPPPFPPNQTQLRRLDRALYCQICKEPFQGPVSIACGHSFCSQVSTNERSNDAANGVVHSLITRKPQEMSGMQRDRRRRKHQAESGARGDCRFMGGC